MGRPKGCFGNKHTEETKRRLSDIAKKRIGRKANHWKGGKIIVSGYIYIYSPKHPNKTKDKYVCEHRLVMEKHIGRYLKRSEVVHHLNHNKLDNRIENLVLFPSAGIHSIKEHIVRDKKSGCFSK